MQLETDSDEDGGIHVENIGGIDEATVEFSPGVTILVGRNATNRTSLLQAFMAACGSTDVSIKGDADEGHVELKIGEEIYSRTLQRRSGTIVPSGEPYLDDSELVDLFAFLLESNEARRAVASGEDLRDIIMRPVDTKEIQEQIEERIQERQRLETELEEIDEQKSKLPGIEERRQQLREDIEEKKSDLESKEEELAEADADLEETREEKEELEEKLDELQTKRSDLDDIRYDLETEQESISELEREKQELEAELEELPDSPTGDVDEINTTIDRMRERKQTIESEVSELQSVIGFNEEMLEDTNSDLFEMITDGDDNVTDQLLEDDEVICWTCGSEVDQDQIQSTVQQLRQLSQEKVSEINDIDNDLEELTEEVRQLERAQQNRNRIERRLRQIETELDESEAKIETLREQRTELTEEIETLEQEVEALEHEEYSTILDLHKEANQLEYDIGRLENELEDVNDEIAAIEKRIDERDEITARLETVKGDISELRTRIDRIEGRAVEEFNDHMENVLELLDYTNLDRIWIERVERQVREGRRTTDKSIFELHVVRTTESGTAYEDTVDHLSESEREVTGLIFALAGYLAHEVYEVAPFMLLDSLEALDAKRIAALIEYLSGYSEYLLVALLPEDAAELTDEYHRITEI